MQFILSLFDYLPHFDLPYHWLGWLSWLVLWAGLVLFTYRLRQYFGSTVQRNKIVMVLLILASIPATLFLGIGFPQGNRMPVPGMPIESSTPVLMFFAALPWVLGAGLLGLLETVVIAGLSGLILGLWGTHSIFTPLEFACLALIYSLAIRQRYRTIIFKIIRQPFVAVFFVILVYAPVNVLSSLVSSSGNLAARMDYAINDAWIRIGLMAGMLLLAAIPAQIIILFKGKKWDKEQGLRPSPAETSLEQRFLLGLGPLLVGVVFLLVIGDWFVAGQAARRMIEDRLVGTGKVAAESIPYFLEAGQNLILVSARPDLLSMPSDQASETLGMSLRSVPFFQYLALYNSKGELTASYPPQALPTQLSMEERAGIQLGLRGVAIQTYSIPTLGKESAQIVFMSSIEGDDANQRGVLLGYTDLSSNPFTQSTIRAIQTLRDIGGEGYILDESLKILYTPSPAQILTAYQGIIPDEALFFDEISSLGTRQYTYYQPVAGKSWAIIITVPANQAQQIALEIAAPLLGLLLVFVTVIAIFWQFQLKKVTGSLQSLAKEATLISKGQLDQPLGVAGVDEVGRFSQAFEQMRVSLKARLEELSRLLMVSQGIAAHLDPGQAVKPVLVAALGEGAVSARVTLTREVSLQPQKEKLTGFGYGSAANRYAYLDNQIFELMSQQNSFCVPNTVRMRRLQFTPGVPQPGAIAAVAVRHENDYYGALWVAYDTPYSFTDEEMRFLSTLAGQAALAAVNAQLYASAELGRQQLEAVLTSTPDPVLVFDEANRLLLLNPAALEVPDLIQLSTPGTPIGDVVNVPELVEFITSPSDERVASREISLGGRQVFFANLALVQVERNLMGRVCIMRDITYYKQLDEIKSDFVATVSHDLRSPLTLIRGYATMLEMVGGLNEQQVGYAHKIMNGVDSMSHLVNNLLDLGRIETGIGLQVTKVSCVGVMNTVISSLQPQAAQKKIQIEQDINTQNSVIEADLALLQQAITNLVENSIKYTPVGGKVGVKLSTQNSRIIFEISDNGIGIAPLDLPRVFEKFYRSGNREANQQRGTGLGLAIVKSISERHGGRVWVESQLGKGSRFYLELPLTQEVKRSV